MAVTFKDNKIIINLSNTESIGSSIYNYIDLQKTKESSVSSTSSYFLSTNLELSKKVIEYLDCDNSTFIVDINLTKLYIKKIDELLKKYEKKDFHGELRDYYNYRDYYLSTDLDFEIGFAKANIEDSPNGRAYLRFKNEDERIKKFRSIIIAIFSNLIIEKRNGKNYIFPVIKDGLEGVDHENTKKEFKSYMIDIRKLKEISANQYIDYIDYTSNDAIKDGILNKSIYEYNDVDEVRDILETLRQNDHFNEITFKRDHINTAAVGNYINFLEYKNSNNNQFEEDIEELQLDTVSIEAKLDSLITKLKSTSNTNEKAEILKEIIRNCYEMMNYYK